MKPGTLVARYLTHSPLRGAAIGAGVGAFSRAAQQPREGETRGQAMTRGALQGAALGGAASGFGRMYRDTKLLDPSLRGISALSGTAARVGTGIRDFAKRQAHGFTGAYKADAIGMSGNVAASKRINLLNRRALDDVRHEPHKAEEFLKRHKADVAEAKAQGARGQVLQDAGITTIPGIAKALRDPNKRNQALRAMGSTLAGGGPGGAAMALGAPLAFSAPSLLRGNETATGGPSMGQKVRGLGASVLSGAAVGGLPVFPGALAGGALDAAARRVAQGKREQS